MRYLVAPDKFKGTMAALEVAEVASGLRDGDPTAEVDLLPIADGGKGTAKLLAAQLNADTHTVVVSRADTSSWVSPFLDLRKRGWERLDQTIVVIVELITKSRGQTKPSINCRTPSEADKDLLKTALDNMPDDYAGAVSARNAGGPDRQGALARSRKPRSHQKSRQFLW
jgi:hypothetical protein